MFIDGGGINCIWGINPGRPMRPFLTVGAFVFVGSSNICNAKRHMKASLPELCIVTLGMMSGAAGEGKPVGEGCGASGVVGEAGAGEVRGEVVKERSKFSRERVDPCTRALLVFGSSMIPR